METPDRFKNSPIHDKSAILELMDELKPEQMVELVDYLQKRVKLLRQPPVMGSMPTTNDIMEDADKRIERGEDGWG
jgi:hypothetical protein